MIPIDENKIEKSIPILEKSKVAVFIVSYNAEDHIASVLSRIPEALRSKFREVFLYFKSAPGLDVLNDINDEVNDGLN